MDVMKLLKKLNNKDKKQRMKFFKDWKLRKKKERDKSKNLKTLKENFTKKNMRPNWEEKNVKKNKNDTDKEFQCKSLIKRQKKGKD